MNRVSPELLILLLFTTFYCLPVHRSQGQVNYSIQHYTNENGLPANSIKGLELDRENGFLWIGTQAGIVRFDGKKFQHFGSVQQTAIPSRTYYLAKNREGTIYCEDENFFVYRVKKNRTEWETLDTMLIAPTVIRDGRYEARPAEQLSEILRNSKRSSFLPPWALFHDETGDSNSVSFTIRDHSYYYSSAKDSLFDFPGFDGIIKVQGKVYYVRTGTELWTFDEKTMQLMPAPVRGIPAWNAADGEPPVLIWKPGMKAPVFIYKKDIWRIKHSGEALLLEPVCRECTPENARINAVQIWEEQGLIFLGSEVSGLYIIRMPFLKSVKIKKDDEIETVEYAQVEIEPGIINTRTGLSFSEQGTLLPGGTKIRFPLSNIYQQKQGDCWFSAGDTVIHYYRETGRYSKVVLQDKSWRIVFAETRNRLFAVADMSITDVTGDQRHTLYKLPSSIQTQKNTLEPSTVIEWQPGVLAIAGQKLMLFDTEKGIGPDTIPIPELRVSVRSLLKYGNYLLIGTYGQGFYMYKEGVVKKMPLDKNGYLSFTHCFMPDDNGFCWISTNHGLFKASLQTLIAAYENNLTEIYYHYFGKDDGIYNTEFNGGCQPCALKLSNGWFSFPAMNGVALLNPYQTHSPPPTGQLFIEEIRSDTFSYQPNDKALLALPANQQNLSFKIALPQFGNTENVYFSYKLEPYHDAWQKQELTENNTLNFGRLPPGRYTLYLRVRNGFEATQFGITTIEFEVLSPWYQQWWFYFLYAGALVLTMWALVKWRTARINRRKTELQQLVSKQTINLEQQSRQLTLQLNQLQNQQLQLEEDNKIKARLIGIISHDMISPLKFMAFMSKELGQSFDPADARYRKANLIGNVAKDLESLSVNVLNWIRFHHESLKIEAENFNVFAAIEEAVVIPFAMAIEKGVSFYNDVPEHLEVYHFRQIIGVVVYNLSMNAMKYTSEGEIRISCEYNDQGFSLSVADTGAGMPAELVKRLNDEESFVTGYSAGDNKKYQFGYVIIKDLLRMSRGRMQVESVLNKGTKVVIHFQLPESTGSSKQLNG